MTGPFGDWPWGWCRECRLLVNLADDGRLGPHGSFYNKEQCAWAGTLPTTPPEEGDG